MTSTFEISGRTRDSSRIGNWLYSDGTWTYGYNPDGSTSDISTQQNGTGVSETTYQQYDLRGRPIEVRQWTSADGYSYQAAPSLTGLDWQFEPASGNRVSWWRQLPQNTQYPAAPGYVYR